MLLCLFLLQVVSLDAQAAYQLCAVAGKSLLLWDLRAGPAAAGSLPLPAAPTVLRALPGGQVLLSAEANGQVGWAAKVTQRAGWWFHWCPPLPTSEVLLLHTAAARLPLGA